MLARAARETVHAIEPGRAVYSAPPLTDALSATLSQQQFRTLRVGAFSALALRLATIGLYGVMTCSPKPHSAKCGLSDRRRAGYAGAWSSVSSRLLGS